MREKFYITTSIAYVNAPPHIGHALELVQADAIARRQRLLGKEVYFLTGADEHGAKITKAAQKSSKKIEEFVEENSQAFRLLAQKLNISNDDFIRTTDKIRHFPAAQEMWKRVRANGDIYKKHYEGLYCLGHEAFVTEKDLLDGKCEIHGLAPEKISEENYFFRLSGYSPKLKELISSDKIKIIPKERKNETLSFIEEGLEDISISRPSKDIAWGVPVPGDASQTIYVWFEALVNYVSALGFASANLEKFEKFWPADLHVIGKDIFRFHALIWPAMLLSAKIALPGEIFIHGFITVGGKKMSKSLGNVIDPFYYIEKYGADSLRHYLLKAIPVFEDGDFTEEKFKEIYNGDLVNGLGNFVSRASRMAIRYFNGNIQKPDDALLAGVSLKARIFFPGENKKPEDLELGSLRDFMENKIRGDYSEAMEEFKLNQALGIVFELLKTLDGYVDEYKPFKLINENREKTLAVIWNLCFGAVRAAELLGPFMPETSEKILNIFKYDEKNQSFQISEHEPLFPRK